MRAVHNTSRWNKLWPVDTQDSADAAIKLAFWAAVCCASATLLVVVLASFGVPLFVGSPAGLLDAALFGVIAWGLWRRSRAAALSGLLLYVIEKTDRWLEVGPPRNPTLVVIFVLAFVAGIRGTLAYHRLASAKPKPNEHEYPLPLVGEQEEEQEKVVREANEQGEGIKAYWKLVLRDFALLWAINFWGGFISQIYLDYLQSFNQQPNLSPPDISVLPLYTSTSLRGLPTFITAPIGFCIVGCLTHSFRHLLIVWLAVWLTSFAYFPFFNEPPVRFFVSTLIGGFFWSFLAMLSGWGASSAILEFFSPKANISFQTSPLSPVPNPTFAGLFPDKVSKEKE